jgi:hypothetical protein
MAEQLSSFQFENVPLDEAHRLSRWPRMNQELYHALKQKIQALDNTATTRMPPLTCRTNFVASRMALGGFASKVKIEREIDYIRV